MSRSMKFGVATILATFVFTLLIPEDAEARWRRRGRWRGGYSSAGGCCGVPVSCCGVAAAPVSACPTGACGVATSACPGGICDVSGGAYSGGYSAGYGSQTHGQPTLAPTPQGTYRQNGLNQSAPPPAPNGSTIRQETQLNGNVQGSAQGDIQGGAAASPSDRGNNAPPPPPAGGEGSAGQGGERSAPPPPPEQ
jgi:hypothetical protein